MHARDSYGFTPLYRAAGFGCKDAVEILLAYGADVHARDSNGATSLHLAVLSGNSELVVFLLANGADVNVISSNLITPLYILQLRYLSVELLLAQGKNNDAPFSMGLPA